MSSTTATVLFTDLVDSTRLTVEYRSAYDEARRTHDALLRSAIEAHGGRVVKGLGDGFMATFGAGLDAVSAARAAQQAIHRLNRQGREPRLAIRAGLAAGDVSVEGDDLFGEPVIEAARLCGLADGDQILATDVVQAIAGARRAPGYLARGPMELKGLPHPVEVVEVEWERVLRSTVPLPPRLAADVDADGFVGRAAELEALQGAFDRVDDDGRREVVLVGGEPGLGKTALVSQAVRSWHDAGATVAMGRCEEDLRAPYQPFIEALEHLVGAAAPEVLHDHVRRHGAALVPLAPGLARRVPELPATPSTDPETERFLLFSAVADLLEGMAEPAPLVLFLDDLHWADAGTASLLRAIAAASEPARLLVTGTFRVEELAPDHPMGQALAAMRRVPAVTRVRLDGLAGADIRTLVEQWAGMDGGPAAARLADDLLRQTDGNAFFVTEVVRDLKESGRLEGLADDRAGSLMPDSIREVLGDRVGRLGAEGDEVLSVAAVAGGEFDLALLMAVTDRSEGQVVDILDRARAAALVREVGGVPGRFGFTHALVQGAILANLGATREAVLHRRVAETLEAASDADRPVAQLAHHWLRATATSDGGRARDYAVEAGEAALAALAPGDAVRYFRQALLLQDQLEEDLPTRIDLLVRLGEAERQAGDPEHRDTLLKAGRLAERIGDDDRLAEAALTNNSGSFSTFLGVDEERVAMLERSVRVDGDEARRAQLVAALACELTYSGDYARRRRLADEALQIARASGDAALLVRVSNLVFSALWVPDTLAERVALTDESLALLEVVRDPSLQYWCTVRSVHNLFQVGRIEEGDRVMRQCADLSDRLAQPAMRWRICHITATRHLLAGDPEAAEPLAVEARALGEGAGEPEALVYFRSQEMGLHWVRGTMADLGAKVRGRPPRPPHAAASLAMILAEAGRDDDARAFLDLAVDSSLSDLPRDPAHITSLALFAEAAILLGHTEAALLLSELLLPYADQVGFDGVVTVGALEHYLGVLASTLEHHDEAVERLERARDRHARIPAPFFEARSAYHLACARLRRGAAGDGEAARRDADRAAALAADGGYRMVQVRTEALLAAMDGGQ